MKKLLTILLILISYTSFSQVITNKGVIVDTSTVLKTVWQATQDSIALRNQIDINTDSLITHNLRIIQLRDSMIAHNDRLNTKQDNITLTTIGTSGAATLVGATLNIPQYTGGAGGGIDSVRLKLNTDSIRQFSGGTGTFAFRTQRVFNVRDYGAKGDGKIITDVNITSGTATLTSATANFSANDVGKYVQLQTGGTGGYAKVVTITGFTNSTTVTLSANADATVTNGVAKYGTDDTAPIQKAIDSALAAYTATVYIPNGLYIIAGALQSPSNSQLVLPVIPNDSTYDLHARVLTIKGEGRGAFSPSTIANTTASSDGATLLSFAIGSGAWPSIISCGTVNTYGQSYIDLKIENMNWQVIGNTATGAALGGINSGWAINFSFKELYVAGDVNQVRFSTLPTNNYAGIIAGQRLQGTVFTGDNSMVLGFRFGFITGEHFTGNGLIAFGNYYGFNISKGAQTQHFSRLGVENCVYGLVNVVNYPQTDVNNSYPQAVISVTNFNIEMDTVSTDWYKAIATIMDTGNVIRGRLNYQVNASSGYGVTNNAAYVKIGGTQLHTMPLTTIDSTLTITSAIGGIGLNAGGADGALISSARNKNAATYNLVRNSTSGTLAYAGNFASADATGATSVGHAAYSAGFTTSGIRVAGAGVVNSTMSGGLNVGTSSGTNMSLWTNDTKRLEINATGGFLFNGTAGTKGQVLYSNGGAAVPTWGPTVQALTDGATITWNYNNGSIATVTLGGNRTLAITNPPTNAYGQITITQDGTGSRTITLPAGSKVINGGAGAITLTTTAGAKDILTFWSDGVNYYWNYGKNYN